MKLRNNLDVYSWTNKSNVSNLWNKPRVSMASYMSRICMDLWRTNWINVDSGMSRMFWTFEISIDFLWRATCCWLFVWSWPTISQFIISHLVTAKTWTWPTRNDTSCICVCLHRCVCVCLYLCVWVETLDPMWMHTCVYALLNWLLVREHVSHCQDVYNCKHWKM